MAAALAITTNTIEASTDPDPSGWWWTALTAALSGLFSVLLLAVIASILLDRRRPKSNRPHTDGDGDDPTLRSRGSTYAAR